MTGSQTGDNEEQKDKQQPTTLATKISISEDWISW